MDISGSDSHHPRGHTLRYRGFDGGGFGLGTPVVSYAPLPMLVIVSMVSRNIIGACVKLWSVDVSHCCGWRTEMPGKGTALFYTPGIMQSVCN